MRPTVPSEAASGALDTSLLTSKHTLRPDACEGSPTMVGTMKASLPFFLLSHPERASGIAIPHAGFGQVTVLAQIHATTVALVPPGRDTLG